ncbi:hypothetical protein IQ277_31520 [Nostocales cyanobacterium LEGE 12452]|nr:hypothetical protein [Nostocales cyanobacterium LEGE 12452]
MVKIPTVKQITDPPELDKHILSSYSMLRWCMGILSLIFPLLLVFGGNAKLFWLSSPLEIQHSLSAYYHAGVNAETMCTAFAGVYRDIFVGILVALSLCLLIYKGFGKLEDWLLNVSGISLACVAFFPMGWPEKQMPLCKNEVFDGSKLLNLEIKFLGQDIRLHFIAASIFFLMLILVNIFTAMDSVDVIEDKKKQTFWRNIFQWARWVMPVSLLLGLFVCLLTKTDYTVLWLEWIGIWAFSFYWLLKSFEIMQTKVDEDMIKGTVQRKGAPSSPTGNEASSPPMGKLSKVRGKPRGLVRVSK